MVDPVIRVGVDVGCNTHQVGIASPNRRILEESSIPHTQDGFKELFERIVHYRRKFGLPVAVAMGGTTATPVPLDRMILEKGVQALQRE